jgi:hypothetical protein
MAKVTKCNWLLSSPWNPFLAADNKYKLCSMFLNFLKYIPMSVQKIKRNLGDKTICVSRKMGKLPEKMLWLSEPTE